MRFAARPLTDNHAFLAVVASIELLVLGVGPLLIPLQTTGGAADPLGHAITAIAPFVAASGLALITAHQLLRRQPRALLASRLFAVASLVLLSLIWARNGELAIACLIAALALGLLMPAQAGRLQTRAGLPPDEFMSAAAIGAIAAGLVVLFLPIHLSGYPPSARLDVSQTGGALMLCSGIAVWAWRREARPLARFGLPIVSALPMLVWVYAFAVPAGRVGIAAGIAVLAIGVLSRPILPDRWLALSRRRLAGRLVVAVVLSVGTAFVVLVAILLRQSESAYQERAQLDLSTMSELVARESASFVDSRIQQATLQSRDPEVLGFDPEVQFAFIARVGQNDPDVSQVSITNRDGLGVARSGGVQSNLNRRAQIPGLEQVYQTHQPTADVLISPIQQTPVLAVRVPIFQKDGTFDGVYTTLVRLTVLMQRLGQMPLASGGRIVIVDRAGLTVVHPDPTLVAGQADLARLPPVAAALAGNPRAIIYPDGARQWLSVQSRVPSLGWTVLVERPESEVLAPATRARHEAFGVLGAMLLLLVACATVFARSFSQPLVKLARAARSLGSGAAAAELPLAGEDEVGDLVHAFDEMQRDLLARRQERDAAEAERAGLLAREQETRAEVEALLAATATLGAQQEPEEVLRTLVEQAAALLEAERAHYAVPRRGRIVIRGRWSEGRWTDDDHEPRRTGILASVLQTGRPFRSNDVLSEPRTNHPRAQAEGLHSQLTVPIIVADREAIGFIVLQNSRRPEGFTDRDERFLVSVCETSAAILRRAQDTAARVEAERNAVRRKHEVEALLAAADRLSAADVEPAELLPKVLAIAADLLEVGRGAIATNEGDHALSRYEWTDGSCRPTDIRLALHASELGWVCLHGRPRKSGGNAGSVDRQSPAIGRQASGFMLTVPIPGRGGKVLGALSLAEPRDGAPFSDDDQRLAEGIAHHVAVALERATLIQELRQREEHLHRLAVTDSLTGLPNRLHFLERFATALAHCHRTGRHAAVLFLDLDGFKRVNDTLGQPMGDALLHSVGRRLLECSREQDLVARFGGDEFAVLLADVSGPSASEAIAERILAEMRRPFVIEDQQLTVTASVGIAASGGETNGANAEDLLREADIALYEAKSRGKDQFSLFTRAIDETNAEHRSIVA